MFFFEIKIRRVVKFLIEIMLLKASCQTFAEVISKCYQHRKTFRWKMTTAWCKKFSHEWAPCVCLSFGTMVMAIAILMAFGILMGVTIISLGLSIDLDKYL